MNLSIAKALGLLLLPLLAACTSSVSEPARTAIVTMTRNGDAYFPTAEDYLAAREDIARLLAAHRLELSERTTEAAYLVTLMVTEKSPDDRLVPLSVISVETNPYRRTGPAAERSTRDSSDRPTFTLDPHRMHPSFELAEALQREAQLTAPESQTTD